MNTVPLKRKSVVNELFATSERIKIIQRYLGAPVTGVVDHPTQEAIARYRDRKNISDIYGHLWGIVSLKERIEKQKFYTGLGIIGGSAIVIGGIIYAVKRK